jgi:nitroreductase/dihydropteridine reductase
MDITHYAQQRYAVKAYDKTKKISDENIDKIKDLLRFSPSSVNSQPWHFILTGNDNIKQKITKATDDFYPVNSKLILNASHTIIFCIKSELDEKHLTQVLAKEESDGRFDQDKSFKEKMQMGRAKFVGLHQNELKDYAHWAEKQLYLNLGSFLLGVATLGIDATPMEGIDRQVLDAEFHLREKGLNSVFTVALGYSDKELDFNAKLPKSRLDVSEIITEV